MFFAFTYKLVSAEDEDCTFPETSSEVIIPLLYLLTSFIDEE